MENSKTEDVTRNPAAGSLLARLGTNPITWIAGLLLLLIAWPLAMIKVIGVTVIAAVASLLAYVRGRSRR